MLQPSIYRCDEARTPPPCPPRSELRTGGRMRRAVIFHVCVEKGLTRMGAQSGGPSGVLRRKLDLRRDPRGCPLALGPLKG